MAKELAMVENNTKGKFIRRWFIERDKTLKALEDQPQIAPPAPTPQLSPAFSEHLQHIDALIARGIEPTVAARTALRYAPSPQEIHKIDALRKQREVPEAVAEILELMDVGTVYTIAEIAALLPPRHPLIRKRSLPSQCSSIGKLMEKARDARKVEKSPSHLRKVSYTRIAEIIANPEHN